MHAGHIEQVGAPRDVWHHPANAFVAGFLGWNVTEAFGAGRVAVRPESLQLGPPSGVRGTVASRTFRRDHFLVEVTLDDGSTIQVAVGIDGALPEVGATVGLTAQSVVPVL